MKVQVRKCRFTGKLFEEKDLKKYAIHLKNLRASMKEKREEDRVEKDWNEWLSQQRATIVSVDDIVPWFLKNQKRIMRAANALADGFKSDKFYPETDEFTEILLKVQYSPFASNSHQSPDTGVLNWCAKDPAKPKSYKGWVGNVSGTLKRLNAHNYSYPYGRALNIVGLKTATGGGGNKDWSYGVTIFLDDWPGLGQVLTVKKLKGVE